MSADQSIREAVADALRVIVPPTWHIIPEQRMPETISQTTVVIKHARIERLAEAPIGHLKNEITLFVFDPRSDIAAAEDALDDAVLEVLTAIDGHAWLNWVTASKVLSPNETYLGWDISLTAISARTPEPEPTPDSDPEEA